MTEQSIKRNFIYGLITEEEARTELEQVYGGLWVQAMQNAKKWKKLRSF